MIRRFIKIVVVVVLGLASFQVIVGLLPTPNFAQALLDATPEERERLLAERDKQRLEKERQIAETDQLEADILAEVMAEAEAKKVAEAKAIEEELAAQKRLEDKRIADELAEAAKWESKITYYLSEFGQKAEELTHVMEGACSPGTATRIRDAVEKLIDVQFKHPQIIAEGKGWQTRKAQAKGIPGMALTITCANQRKKETK